MTPRPARKTRRRRPAAPQLMRRPRRLTPKKPGTAAGPRRTALPGFVEPQLATLIAKAPDSARWIHEIKFDGYRIQARLEHGKVKLMTRKGLDWTDKFPTVAEAVAGLPADTALMDGELVSEDKDGVSRFSLLQQDLKDGRHDRMVYYAFDLLHCDGADLKPLPLTARKAALGRLLARAHGAVRFSESLTERGSVLLKQACKMGLEGIISKVADAPYRSGRGHDWLKSKCSNRQEFVVAGFTPSTADAHAVGALVLGVYRRGKLHYAGRTGTGFTHQTARSRRARAGTRRSTPCPRKSAAAAGRSGSIRKWWWRSIFAAGPTATACDRPRSRACATTSRPDRWCGRRRHEGGPAEPGKAARRPRRARGRHVRRRQAHASRPHLLERCRRQQERPRPILRKGLEMDAAACRRPRHRRGALPGRRRRPVLLPEARAPGHPHRIPASGAGKGRQGHRRRRPRRHHRAGAGRRAGNPRAWLEHRRSRQRRPPGVRPRSRARHGLCRRRRGGARGAGPAQARQADELRQDHRRQGATRGGADQARTLGGRQGVLPYGGAEHGEGRPRTLSRHRDQGAAAQPHFRRLPAQQPRGDGDCALLLAGAPRRAGGAAGGLVRARLAQERQPIHRAKCHAAAVEAAQRPLGEHGPHQTGSAALQVKPAVIPELRHRLTR